MATTRHKVHKAFYWEIIYNSLPPFFNMDEFYFLPVRQTGAYYH